MPRPCSFDRDAVVDAALDAFWCDGYTATSTEDLCSTTGLSRSSLYNSFGGKAELYREALERYGVVRSAERTALIDQDGTGRERLAALLTQCLADQEGFTDRRTCLAVNAAVEVGTSDPQVADLARRTLLVFREIVADLIAVGQADGSIRADRPPAQYAAVVHAALNGLQIAARVETDPDAPRRALDTLLALL